MPGWRLGEDWELRANPILKSIQYTMAIFHDPKPEVLVPVVGVTNKRPSDHQKMMILNAPI